VHPAWSIYHDLFFDELANVLDRIATVREPIFVAINIRLDRPDKPNACLFDIFRLSYICGPPCRRINARLGRYDRCRSFVFCLYDAATVTCGPVDSMLDSGLSDHRLLPWSVAAGTLPPPPSRKTTCRAWRRLWVNDFTREVQAPALWQRDSWQLLNLDEMAAQYNSQ
jgi:hypothetical protein